MKNQQPRVLLMNLPSGFALDLHLKGFETSTGSFGHPYTVSSHDQRVTGEYYITLNDSLPTHYAESEIVVIDLSYKDKYGSKNGPKVILEDGYGLTLDAPLGYFDPRPLTMRNYEQYFHQIYNHGGIFILFASPKSLVTGSMATNPRNRFTMDSVNSWAFLDFLASENFTVTPSQGREVILEEGNNELNSIIGSYMASVEYSCTFDFRGPGKKFIPIAKNRFQNTVAGLITSSDIEKGLIFIFPHVENKSEFLQRFLNEYLPILKPNLFPDLVKKLWVQSSEYELPKILKIQAEIEQIERQALAQVTALKNKINDEREEQGYLHELLTETGDNLVRAVKKALATLGFEKVVDVDHNLKEAEKNENKKEDLQIHDRSPLLLVEVKGIFGHIPKESEMLQVTKHYALRMREFKTVEISGLTILNSERHKPALERVEQPFSEDLLETAKAQQLGFLTTWNLHKLLRNYLKFKWTSEQVQGLFYQYGFINSIPLDYEYIGQIEDVWPKVDAIGIRIEEGDLKQDDLILYELEVEYEIQKITSLQVDKNPVEIAEKGQLAGVSIGIDKDKLKKKTRIYRQKR